MLEAVEEMCWRRLMKIPWREVISDEEVLDESNTQGKQLWKRIEISLAMYCDILTGSLPFLRE